MQLFDPRACVLGEGPLWHPERQQLFWFDIMNKVMLTQTDDGLHYWSFDDQVSAAGWINEDTLLIASERQLFCFDLDSGEIDPVCDLEAGNPVTRSNDGRADPWGGFWIGTMGKHAETGAGSIWRYHDGELRRLVRDITVPNAICFAPDRSYGYFTDTPTQQVQRVALDAETGWPSGTPDIFLDLSSRNLNPDGAVTDADGTLWIACWDAGQITTYTPDGRHLRDIPVPAERPTCPAFGGPELTDMFITSAKIGLDEAAMERLPDNGRTFVLEGVAQGRAEPRVIL